MVYSQIVGSFDDYGEHDSMSGPGPDDRARACVRARFTSHACVSLAMEISSRCSAPQTTSARADTGPSERVDEVDERAVRERPADGRKGREEDVEVRVLRCCDAAMCACVEGGQPSAWRREEIGGSGGRSRRAVSVLRRGRFGV